VYHHVIHTENVLEFFSRNSKFICKKEILHYKINLIPFFVKAYSPLCPLNSSTTLTTLGKTSSQPFHHTTLLKKPVWTVEGDGKPC